MLTLMETFSSILRIMDGLSRAMKRFKMLSERTNAHTGHSHRLNHPMHSIVLIERLNLQSDGHLHVTAILENERRDVKGTYLFTSPEVAPIRATTIIPSEALPPNKTFSGKNTDELAAMIDRHQLFLHQEWKAIDPEEEAAKQKDDPYPGGRLFF
jgi:hypothetical protein